MIPENRLSTTPQYAEFRSPDNIERPSPLIDYELGGRALNDPTEGLEVHIWTCEYNPDTGDVTVSAPGQPHETIFTELGITALSLTFDQNMRPFVGFLQNGQARYFWYDTVLGGTKIDNLPVDAAAPQCSLDDKRDMQTSQGANDIILAYVRGTGLYYRQQRDRYEIEYLLTATIPGTRLTRMGMNKGLRLQFEFM
jgi:hypothetical protein